MTTGIAFGTLLLFALLGYAKGLVPAMLDLAAAVTTLLAIVLLVRPLAHALEDRSIASGLSAYLIAPGIIVVVVAIAAKILGYALRPLAKDEQGKVRFRGAGAAVNGLAGTIWAALLVWAVMTWQGLSGQPLPASRPFVDRVAGQAVGLVGSTTVGAMYGEEPLAAPAAYQILRDPGRGMRGLKTIVQSPELQGLLADPGFVEVLQGGRREQVLADPRFQKVLADPAIAAALRDTGLSGDPALERRFQERLADALIQLLARAEAMQADAEVQATLNDPAFKNALQSGDIATVLSHKGFPHLMKVVLAPPPVPPARESAGVPVPASPAPTQE